MKEERRENLEAAGGKVGTAEEFLELTEAEAAIISPGSSRCGDHRIHTVWGHPKYGVGQGGPAQTFPCPRSTTTLERPGNDFGTSALKDDA
jgi:hypothetical protein